LAACGLAAAAARAETQAVARVGSKIEAVTVYADRARVTRTGTVRLTAGLADYAFGGLPGWLDEESLRAALAPAAAGQIADVRVHREYLSQSSDEEVRQAETAAREMEDKIADLQDEFKVQEARARQVEDIKVFAMEKLPKDTAVGNVAVESYGKTVEFVAETLRSIAQKRREIERQIRALQPDREARQRKLGELRQRTRLEQCTVTVAIQSPAAAPARLTLDYMLPGAAWEPVHELRAQGPVPTAVALTDYALVSQTTGEDWLAAELTFSTQSPDEVMRVPELDALRIGAGGPTRLPVQQASSFSLAQRKFAVGNTDWYRWNNPQANVLEFNDNGQRQQVVAARTATLFSELQRRRGTTAHFNGESRPAVRSDGRQARVQIGQLNLAAKPRIVAAPEVSLNAAHTVELTNSGRQPLLPGKVTIFHEGAFLGTTDLGFVAEGEPFTALMGVADRIKLARTLDRRRSALVRGQRTRMQVAFDLTVENLAETPAQVRLLDRVPVSEDKEVRVSGVAIEPDGKPDSKGLITWDLDLKPKERRAFRIAYTLEYPEQTVVEKQQQMLLRAKEAAPAAAPEADIYRQIQDLEATF